MTFSVVLKVEVANIVRQLHEMTQLWFNAMGRVMTFHFTTLAEFLLLKFDGQYTYLSGHRGLVLIYSIVKWAISTRFRLFFVDLSYFFYQNNSGK